jgi:hypothetical protein
MCTSIGMKGNSGKMNSIVNFIQALVPSLLEDLNYKINDILSPVGDWVDAYGIQKFLYYKYMYELGNYNLIPDKIIKSIKNSRNS